MMSEVASIKPNPSRKKRLPFSIENKRYRKPRFAYEIREGAKCKKCAEKCSGFQLHSWREICNKCRCFKDDHEDEDIGQILIGKLFERPIWTQEEEELYSYGTHLDIKNEATGKTEKIEFDWVPPRAAKEHAKKYMEQLPAEKRPIAGSEAAKNRKKQLEQQLPLYDIDENEGCENMTPEEYKKFQKYLEIIRNKVAGQAKIQEIVARAPEQFSSLLTENTGDLLPSPPLPPPPTRFEPSGEDSLSSPPSLRLRLVDLISTNHRQLEFQDNIQNNASQGASRTPLPSNVAREGIITYSDANQAPYGAQTDKIRGYGSRVHSDEVNVLLPSESKAPGGVSLRSGPSQNGTQGGSPSHSFSCQNCEKSLVPGDVAVICERAGPDKFWHPSCFVCATCKELLADMIYFYKDGDIYCGRHYHQAVSMPRCHACDELIFGETLARTDRFDWHSNHICCFICDHPLGSKYCPDEKGFPHCISCYMDFLAKICESCGVKISPRHPSKGIRGYFFHDDSKCFCCFSCRKSLMGRRFKIKKNWIFCSQDCADACADKISRNYNPKVRQ